MTVDPGPLIKYGLMLATILALVVGLIAYGEHRKQLEWDAAIAEQAMQTSSEVIDRARTTAKIEVRYIKQKGETKTITQIKEKEVIRYVESPASKCSLSPEFERTFDSVSQLLDGPPDGVPAAAAGAGAAPPGAAPPVTDVEVLRAYEHAVVELRELWFTYRALVEWVRTMSQPATEESSS